jgi:hypothetical protein
MASGKTERKFSDRSPGGGSSGVFTTLNQSPINYLGNILKKYPYLKLIPNSLLGIAVLQEFNSVKGTTNRLPWPEDLCGYISNVEARSQRINREAQLSIVNVNDIPDTKYPIDDCLNRSTDVIFDTITNQKINTGAHLPGSFTYGNCVPLDNLIEDLFDLDWSGFFATPVFPTLDDLSEEDRQYMEDTFGEQIVQFQEAAAAAASMQTGLYGENAAAAAGLEGTAGAFSASGSPQGKEVMSLSVTGISSSTVSFSWSGLPNSWNKGPGEAAFLGNFYIMKDGKWVGGKFEWIRSGGQGVKLLHNIFTGYGGLAPPAKGTKIAFTWSNPSNTERSNLATAVWP